jgi:hypothetical protein
MHKLLAGVCLATSLAASGVALGESLRFDFGDWDAARWLPVREDRYPAIAPFVQRGGHIENHLPPGVSEEDIVATKDGVGVSMMLLRDVVTTDLIAHCDMAFDGKGAPAINFGVQRRGEVVGDTYSLVLYEKGVNLWKNLGGKWSRVGATEKAIAPGVFHEVGLYARGGVFGVYVDGEKLLRCADPSPLGPGEVGIWSGEGPCRFRSMVVRVP